MLKINKNLIFRSIVLVSGTALLALNYNLFLAPNELVTGGTTGISIILKSLFNIDPQIFIYITSFLLLILSYTVLGLKETKNSLIGSILYPIFISLTAPLANLINNYLNFDSIIVVVLIAGILNGVSNGIIFKVGYTTGGSDILMQIINKKFKMPESQSTFAINIIIMIFGAIIFGPTKFIYAVIILYLNSTIINRILTGISKSKTFFIYTKEVDKVKKFIINDLKTGVTILNATGGFSNEKSPILMCVVSNRDYYLFKEKVLEIDNNAFFVINDCYEVSGGVKRDNLPFI